MSLLSLAVPYKTAIFFRLIKPKQMRYEVLQNELLEAKQKKTKKKLAKNKSNSIGSNDSDMNGFGSGSGNGHTYNGSEIVTPSMGFGNALNQEMALKLKQKKDEQVIKDHERKRLSSSNKPGQVQHCAAHRLLSLFFLGCVCFCLAARTCTHAAVYT